MKPLAIVGALCFLFIIISVSKTDQKKLISLSESVLCKNESVIKQPLVLDRKKLKSKQMPSWQRVIPGMFR
jgi:hypothetical protein